MSAEVICLSSSSSSSSSSSDEDVTASSSVVKVKSSNKSTAAAHGGGNRAQKRHLSPAAAAAAVSSNRNIKKVKVEHVPAQPAAGCSSKAAVGALLPVGGIDKERKVIKPQLVVVTKIPIPPADEDVFQNFVKTCLKRRDDKDTKQVLFKLEKLHSKLSAIQKQDNEFRLLVSNCHNMISKGLTKDIYTPIWELHTEIKRLIKPAMEQQQMPVSADTAGGLQQQQEIGEESQVSREDMKKIKLLESSIAKCLLKIKKLEEKEVDFDDDNDSAYIQEDKYKKRLIQLCNALSEVSGDKVLRKQLLKKKIRRKDISDEMTGIPSVDEAILNLLNSDISKINQFKHLESTQRCADHMKMPEYLDILQCIDKCNKDRNLDLSKGKMEKLAKRAFQTVGNFLKKKRMDETKFYIQSFLDDANEDPAMKDVKLNKKLRENKKEGDKKLEDIFKKYVDKQDGLSQEDIEKQQQQVSSDQTEDDNSSSSGESDTENSLDKNVFTSSAAAAAADAEEETKQQVDNGTEKSVGPITTISKSGIISSSRRSDDDADRERKRANFGSKFRATIDDDDDDDDLFVINDSCDDLDQVSTGTKDPLDINESSSPAAQIATVQTEQLLVQSNEILVVNNDANVDKKSQAVFCQAKPASTPTRIEAASAPQRNVSPPRDKPAAAAALDTASKENTGSNEVNSCCHKTPVIKVCAFAKPPPAWGGHPSSPLSSPEKVKKNSKPSVRQTLQDSPFTSPKRRPPPPPECIDLTKEVREKPASVSTERLFPLPSTSSARSINPLANVKRTTSAAAAATLPQPVKRVTIVENVINNFYVPLSNASAAAAAAAGPRGRTIFHSSRSTFNQNNASNRRNNDAVWLSKEKATVKRPYIK